MASTPLPAIPAKRYFTIGEVGELCEVKPHVLRYWEQEFTQLRPMKRRGNRRYYQHHEVLMIRRIRDLLYEQGFTISGARNKLQEWMQAERGARSALASSLPMSVASGELEGTDATGELEDRTQFEPLPVPVAPRAPLSLAAVRKELLAIRLLLAEPLQI
ncbi:MerR family transcriptional regulator [Xylophilus rhododendri]|uniref:MerR family transcriptional regulator n=1 Tax=Xylophilus rhododendri TaxID=2697032 RepID=A0A857JCN6_9BURK|nr:MerR family transcriptional regulator [Xylophilus rhododendri]QHJ00860.1 MerR family transcriptional regulator [Xylophilus rhododendri]